MLMPQSQTSVALRTSGLGMVTGVESQPLHYIELIEAGRYCIYKGQEDWRRALKDCSKGEAMTFLRYICENDRVNSKESVHQYLKQFKMLYSRANGQRMDTNDGTDIYEV
jgi:hypothetical protein